MNKLGLTIIEVQELTGMSYPTALKYAKKNGKQNGSGRWFVPLDIVRPLVLEQSESALRRLIKMAALEDPEKPV